MARRCCNGVGDSGTFGHRRGCSRSGGANQRLHDPDSCRRMRRVETGLPRDDHHQLQLGRAAHRMKDDSRTISARKSTAGTSTLSIGGGSAAMHPWLRVCAPEVGSWRYLQLPVGASSALARVDPRPSSARRDVRVVEGPLKTGLSSCCRPYYVLWPRPALPAKRSSL